MRAFFVVSKYNEARYAAEDSISNLKHALSIVEDIEIEDSIIEYRRFLARVIKEYGRIFMKLCDYEMAMKYVGEAEKLLNSILDKYPNNIPALNCMGWTLLIKGITYTREGRYKKAEETFIIAINNFFMNILKLTNMQHTIAGAHCILAYKLLADVQILRGKLSDALNTLIDGNKLADKIYKKAPMSLFVIRNRALLVESTSKYMRISRVLDESRRLLEETIRQLEKILEYYNDDIFTMEVLVGFISKKRS